MSATALIRRPSSHLDEGIVSHIEREPVDVARAVEQWEGYVAVLQTSGWHTVEVPPADNCPDSVFVEDTMVVFGGTVVISRPGTPTREPETTAAEETVSTFGYDVQRITAPGGRVLVLDLREHQESWVQTKLGDRILGFSETELKRLLTAAGLVDVQVAVGARRTGDPFTVLLASGTRPVAVPKARPHQKTVSA